LGLETTYNVRRKPNLFLIGAPKCGTTSMVNYLNDHPEVFSSAIKEPHYFNTDSNHRYCDTLNQYLDLFSNATPKHKYLLEGSVWYLYSDVAIKNILEFNPDAKFMVMLRNPVSMFFSLHKELLFGGSETIKDPIEAWNLQNNRRYGINNPIGTIAREKLQYGDVCKLGKQAQKAADLIPTENLQFILLDDLIENPDKTFRNTCSFLNIKQISLKHYSIYNKSKSRRSNFLADLIRNTSHIKRKLGIKKGTGIARKINEMNTTNIEIINKKQKIAFTATLLDYFYKDIILLEKVINRDLKIWKS
jgi:hypothetical protein